MVINPRTGLVSLGNSRGIEGAVVGKALPAKHIGTDWGLGVEMRTLHPVASNSSRPPDR